MSSAKIGVLIVDDSAVIRGGLKRLLLEDDTIEVIGSASNGEVAITSAKNLKPDVIILDIEMPVMDGIQALPNIKEASPNSKIIMFSAHTTEGGELSLKALSLGAAECLLKPKAGEAEPGSDFQKNLIRIIRNLVPKTKSTYGRTTSGQSSSQKTTFTLRNSITDFTGKPDLLAIGSSTGGPKALFEALKPLKGIDIPIILTQHMPATFTKVLAEHIETQTGIPTREGEEGMVLKPGHVYVAPGGFHMLLKRTGIDVSIVLNDGPQECFCKPSVNPMLRSAIEIYNRKILCTILTGMGNDGLESCTSLVEKGGRVIAQDEATSTVWGMPGAVATAGICSHVLPLQEIGSKLRTEIMGR